MPILMQEQIESHALSYAEVYSAFRDVANRLGEYYIDGSFSKALPQFKNYHKNLSRNLRRINKSILLNSLSGEEGKISISNPKTLLKDKIVLARMASFCCAFGNWQVFLHNNIEAITKSYLVFGQKR